MAISRRLQILTLMHQSAALHMKAGGAWLGRPFEVSRLAPTDDETSKSAAQLSAVPLYKREPSDVTAEKEALYEAAFQQIELRGGVSERISMSSAICPVSGHCVGVTTYLPKERPPLRGVCLHCHGGGWLWGNSKGQVAHRLLRMAERLGIAVVSVDYRMGPSHRWPTAVDDVTSAASWLAAHAQNEFGTDVVIGSGESSGAQLITLAALRIMRRDGRSPFRCLNQVYGVFDLSGTPSMRLDGDASAPLSGKELAWLIDQHLPPDVDRRAPDVSPLYADLSGMPPALFSCGTADPLLDDTLFMASRWGAAGAEAEIALYNGGQHGIGHFGPQEDVPLGVEARERTEEFLGRFLTKPEERG